METNKYLFVSPSISSTDKKASELAKSEARAHAARVSHPRQQRPARSPQKPTPVDTRPDDLEQSSPDGNGRDGMTPSGGKPKKARKPRSSKGIIFRVNVPKSKSHSPGSTDSSPQARSDVGGRSPSLNSQVDHSDTESNDSPSPVSVNTFNPVQLFKSISKSTLDPFYRPAADLSVADSHLLHNCLWQTMVHVLSTADSSADFTRVPNEIFGTTSSSLSKTISGGAYEGMATNEIQLMWCLIAMESQGISFQPTDAERRMSILSRRNYVYNLMREQLSDEKTARLTPFVLSVAGAAYIENRLGNYEHAKYHTRALKKLLDLWGGIKGIRDLQYPFGLMVFNILIEIGLPELYSYQGLLRKLPQLRLKLRELQAWNHNLVSSSSLKPARGTNKNPYLATILRPSDYLTRRLQAFDKPALKDYILYPAGHLTEGQYRFYLCMLYAINSALWAFREKHEASEIYLDSLVDATEMSESKGFILQCFGEKLPSLLMLLMIGHYAASSAKRDEATQAVFADEEAFEFVELMMLASPESRDVVLKALWSWLTSATLTELTCLSNGKLDIVIEEIEDTWLENQKGERLNPSEGRGAPIGRQGMP